MRTLLLVEDEADDAALVVAYFPNASVTHVTTVTEALDHVDDVDVVVLDLSLPDSEGFGTLARLLDRAPQVPVIVLTGNEDPAIGAQALEAGAQEYVHKVDLRDMPVRVEQAIVRQRHRNHAVAQALSASLDFAQIDVDRVLPAADPATLDAIGDKRIEHALPEVFARLVDAYVDVLTGTAESLAYQGHPRPVDLMKSISRDMGVLNGVPRDVIDVHLAALHRLSNRLHPERLSAIAEEGRIVLLETVGYLALYYRLRADRRGRG